ncbi:MAG: carboxypeptidase regulatory-like domain-containing protein [Acidobacteria bacterium]|nr:carboxypeptidase regulatory-like domain-containing protein [Acidobacteriota bacterium]
MILAMLALLAQASGYPLGGTVVHGANGSPLKGVRVRLIESGKASELTSMLTGADGRFRFEALPAGKYMIAAERNGFPAQMYGQKALNAPVVTGVVVGEGQDASDLVFPLIPPATISGRVIDEKGEPLPGMTVVGYQRRGVGQAQRLQFIRRGSTNDLGEFRLYGLPRGDYLVSVTGIPFQSLPALDVSGTPAGYGLTFHPGVQDVSKAAWVHVEPAEEARADVRASASKVVRVSGTLKGTEIPNNSYVWLAVALGDGTYFQMGQSVYIYGSSFQLGGVPPGRYALFAVTQGRRVIARQTVDVADDPSNVEIDASRMAKVRMKVNVRGAKPGETIVASLLTYGERWGPQGTLDSKGEILFGAVAAGLYTVSIVSPDSRVQISPESITAEGARVRGDLIELPESGQVTLTVNANVQSEIVNGRVHKDGRPVSGMTVVLIPARNEASVISYRIDQSDSDGSFKWRNVPPGEYLMFAFEDGASWDYMDEGVMQGFRNLGQPLTVRAAQKGEVRLEVTRVPQPSRQ